MRVLVLGGTVFLGRHVAAEAVARGHEVTLFHRGRHGADLFPEAEHVLGDRGGDLTALRGRAWDAAIDTSGYEPADVARSSALDLCHLVFVSTCNVYPMWPGEAVDEDSPVSTEGDDYGPLKAACERAANSAMPGRVASVRAGLICGPHDNIFRLPWWIQRIAAGGEVVAPGDPERTVQLIDARDLASWMVDLAERRVAGAFNATAPPGRTTMREVLEAAAEATGSGARLRWLPDEVLVEHEVEPWDELPLWIPRDAGAGTWAIATERAQAAGLSCRPVAATVNDTWAWLRDGAAESIGDWRAENRPRGLSRERERELLAM
jgi:nucleoside-diphosphate-sugar epimerase